MFDMTSQQKSAFQAATNGVSAATYCHAILFFVGAIATIWLFLIFMGTIKNNKRSIYDSLYEFVFAIGIFIAIGVVVYYT